MKPLKGLQVVEQKHVTPNTFYTILEDGRIFALRQPRKTDSGKLRKAWKQVGGQSRLSYMRRYVDQDLYDMNKRCNLPLYMGEFPGVLPLVCEVGNTVVGFCDIFFKYGSDFERFGVEPMDKCANGSITALDKYRGLGVGNMYAVTSNYIARHYGCQWILGRTKQEGGMRGIRRGEGWEITGYDGLWVDHKLRLD